MRRLLQLAARLYPRAWRERYGVEFDALMEDVEPGFREVLDVLRGASAMQISNGSLYLRLAAIMALFGAIAGGVASLKAPSKYVSAAVMRVTSAHGGAQASNRMAEMSTQLLGRSGMVKMIAALDLYKGERGRMAMEEVLNMIGRDLKVNLAQASQKDGAGAAFLISFSYPNKDKAREVVGWLVDRFREEAAAADRVIEVKRKIMRRELEEKGVTAQLPNTAPGGRIEILEPPSLGTSSPPNRMSFVAWGLCGGLLLGLLGASVTRRPRWTLAVAVFAASGLVVAAGLSLLIPNIYTSTAVLGIVPPLDPGRWYSRHGAASFSESFLKITTRVGSPENLAQLGRKCGVDPLRREDIVIQPIGAPSALAAIRVGYRCGDRFKAQAVVNELTGQFADGYAAEQQRHLAGDADVELALMQERGWGENLRELDPASMPQVPTSPNRATIAGTGFVGGILFGVVALRIRKRRHGVKQTFRPA